MSFNTDLALRVFDLVDKNDVETMKTLVTADADFLNPFGRYIGPEEFIKNFEPVKAGFPDSRHIIADVYEAGNVIAVEGEWTGTNTGPLMTPGGEVTTGRTVRLVFGGICKIQDELVSAVHIYHDVVVLFQQLGLFKELGKA